MGGEEHQCVKGRVSPFDEIRLFFLLSPIGHSNQNSLIPPEGVTGSGRGATEDVPLECGQF
jgi:hypothetical protein